MSRVLIIGGSGMLAGLCEYYINLGVKVTVLSRTNQKPAFKLKDLKWIQCDYTSEAFKFLIEAYFQEGKVDQVVVWMHSHANENLQWLIQYLNVYHISIYHVRGSQGYSHIFNDHLKNTMNYHQIILGHERQDHDKRWLSNEEISNGVIEAVKAKKKVHIVGHFDGHVESVLF